MLYARDDWNTEMKNNFTENTIRYEEMLGIESTITVQDLILENERLAANDRELFRAMGKRKK